MTISKQAGLTRVPVEVPGTWPRDAVVEPSVPAAARLEMRLGLPSWQRWLLSVRLHA